MKLYVKSVSCDEKMRVKSNASTRSELQMEKGDEFTINCPKSGKIVKVHVNDVMAEVNKLIILMGLIIGITVAVIIWTNYIELGGVKLWRYYGMVGTIVGLIPILFWRQEMRAVKAFNSFLIKRK